VGILNKKENFVWERTSRLSVLMAITTLPMWDPLRRYGVVSSSPKDYAE